MSFSESSRSEFSLVQADLTLTVRHIFTEILQPRIPPEPPLSNHLQVLLQQNQHLLPLFSVRLPPLPPFQTFDDRSLRPDSTPASMLQLPLPILPRRFTLDQHRGLQLLGGRASEGRVREESERGGSGQSVHGGGWGILRDGVRRDGEGGGRVRARGGRAGFGLFSFPSFWLHIFFVLAHLRISTPLYISCLVLSTYHFSSSSFPLLRLGSSERASQGFLALLLSSSKIGP